MDARSGERNATKGRARRPAAVVYTRQRTGQPAKRAAQLAVCREAAARRGADIVDEYTDVGFSGATLERPMLQAMLRRVREGGIRYLVVADVADLTRLCEHWASISRTLRQKDTRLVIAREDRNAPGLGEYLP